MKHMPRVAATWLAQVAATSGVLCRLRPDLRPHGSRRRGDVCQADDACCAGPRKPVFGRQGAGLFSLRVM